MNFNNDLTEQYFEGKYKRKELQDVLVAKEKKNCVNTICAKVLKLYLTAHEIV